MSPMHGAAATFKDHFSSQAGEYARYRPQYPDDLFDWLAVASPALGEAFDLGTGSGQSAWGLAQHFARVRASDPSAAQLAAARKHPRIAYVCERAEAIAAPDSSVDAVVAAQAAHWFDWGAFAAELRRVLRPGGVAAIWTYGRFTAGPGVDAIVSDFYRNVVGPYWPRERRHVEEGYRGLPCPLEPLAPPHFSLENSWSADEVLGYLGTWSAVRRYRAMRRVDPLELLAPALRRAWGEGRRRVRWPIHMKAGRR